MVQYRYCSLFTFISIANMETLTDRTYCMSWHPVFFHILSNILKYGSNEAILICFTLVQQLAETIWLYVIV